MSKNENPVVIIGSGLAGLTLAKELRKLQPEVPLAIITKEAGHFYSKPMLSTALNQGKTPESLIMTQAQSLMSQLNATLYTLSTVKEVFPNDKKIVFHDQEKEYVLHYQQLVFALGAEPKPFPLLDNLPHFRINHLDQYAKFIEAITHKKQLAIIGSGLVGCEFAYDLSHKDFEISVITPDPYPLYGLLPPLAGQYLQKALEDKGILWHGNTEVRAATQQSDKMTLNLLEKTIETEAILCAIGLQPNIGLAKAAGLQVNKGIMADGFLRTSDPNIYALGDCAEIQGVCRQFVAPILACARALARTLSGEATHIVIPPTPIVLKVNNYPVTIFPPALDVEGEWEIEDKDGSIHGTYYDKAGVLQGYVLTGSQIEYRQALLKKLYQAPQTVA